MKTYFNYEAIIKSKDAAEAIAFPYGIGPFCGFGSAKLDNNKLILYPQGIDGSITKLNVADRIRARRISNDTNNSDITFGIIAADGAIYVDDVASIEISQFEGISGDSTEYLVYAVHQQIQEPVENPVSFVAYRNSSTTSFYDLYKRSFDPYYPRLDDATYYTNSDLITNEEFSYKRLCELAKVAAGAGNIQDDTMVLVGIYGTGTNAETNIEEEFAIVPYGGQFPCPLSYNTAMYGMQQNQSKILETILQNIPSDTPILEYIKEYVNSLIKDPIPEGTIVLYNGTVAPEGWGICDGTNGTPDLRGVFVIGAGTNKVTGATYSFENNLSDRGPSPDHGAATITLKVENIPPHMHTFQDIVFTRDKDNSDIKKNDPYYGVMNMGVGLLGSQKATDGDNDVAQWFRHETDWSPTDEGTTPNSFSIIPPYVALSYIMKLPSA